MTELDYGTLLCAATNKIGKQKFPCIFHIIAAGRCPAMVVRRRRHDELFEMCLYRIVYNLVLARQKGYLWVLPSSSARHLGRCRPNSKGNLIH
jgi:hypothetical protein